MKRSRSSMSTTVRGSRLISSKGKEVPAPAVSTAPLQEKVQWAISSSSSPTRKWNLRKLSVSSPPSFFRGKEISCNLYRYEERNDGRAAIRFFRCSGSVFCVVEPERYGQKQLGPAEGCTGQGELLAAGSRSRLPPR